MKKKFVIVKSKQSLHMFLTLMIVLFAGCGHKLWFTFFSKYCELISFMVWESDDFMFDKSTISFIFLSIGMSPAIRIAINHYFMSGPKMDSCYQIVLKLTIKLRIQKMSQNSWLKMLTEMIPQIIRVLHAMLLTKILCIQSF